MIKISTYFLIFIFYSFIGWLMEVILKFIENKRFINRGFLIGPICPIYGYGALLIHIFLSKYQENPLILFCMAILICSILEYYTSLIMEKIFHTRWWDYTDKKFNLNGRICLETMIPFGMLAMLAIYIITPFFLSIINKIPDIILTITSIILCILLIVDTIISTNIIFSFKDTIKNIEKDATEEISKKVKNIFLSKGSLSRRLIKAFPNAKTPKEHLQEIQKRINDKINKLNRTK